MAFKAKNTKPTATYRLGSISLALFENNRKFEEKSYVSRTYTAQKTYKNDAGEFQHISSFSLTDLVVLRQLISNAIADGMISAD